MADKWSGDVFLLVWFHLEILGFIFISVPLGILDRLSSNFGHIQNMGMWESGDGEVACFRVISLFLFTSWLGKLMLSHGVFVCCVRETS